MRRRRLQKRTTTFLVFLFLYSRYAFSYFLSSFFFCVYVAVSEPAPTGSFVQIGANDKGVPQATYPKFISASHCIRPAVEFGSLGLMLLLFTEII